MELISEQKRKEFLKSEYSRTPHASSENIKEFPHSHITAAFFDGINKGINYAENEYKNILLELIESIFNYEKESGSKIIEFDRNPETILDQFIITKKSK